MSDDAGTVVYSWPKNSREEVRATLSTFRGRRLADLRVYVAGADDVDRPTRKGLAVRVEDLPRLLEAVQALIAEERYFAGLSPASHPASNGALVAGSSSERATGDSAVT